MDHSVILAAGEGKRMKAGNVNKTTLELAGKSLVEYGVDLVAPFVDQTVVVIGAYGESVVNMLTKYSRIVYAQQTERLGTGHALKIAVNKIIEANQNIDRLIVGYGDHMMFYKPETIRKLLSAVADPEVGMALVSSLYPDPDFLAWGRVIRTDDGDVDRVVEQKDGNPEELKVNEVNTGLYAFNGEILPALLNQLEPSPVTHEYYLTELVHSYKQAGKRVVAVPVGFEEVGVGSNTPEQMELNKKLMSGRLYDGKRGISS